MGVYGSLIEALSVSATYRETAQTNVVMPFLSLLLNTVNLNQATLNSFDPYYQSPLSRTLLRIGGTTFVETAVFWPGVIIPGDQYGKIDS